MRSLDAVSACVSAGGVERTRGLERNHLGYEGTCAVYNSWLLCVVRLHTMRMEDGQAVISADKGVATGTHVAC